MQAEQKNYECAYLLNPAIEEGALLAEAEKITQIIEDAKGIVQHVEEPKKQALAYPVHKKINAYFGWMTFTTLPEHIQEIKKKLKDRKEFLRFAILEEQKVEPLPQLRTIPSSRQAAQERAIPRAEEKIEEKLDLEALDKKLEEILGN